ncbi:SDR family oxidoreductase [Cohnella cellulosilytica]|uniref:SDR family oxidoreductase n=1 Tax=Cohnella cellulosilytica TaxID=986710 RepID=A0ABW2FEL9_9BACL
MHILITGAGRGLGLELAKLAAEKGHEVIACVRDPENVPGPLNELKDKHPGKVRIERLGVTNEAEAKALADKLGSEGIRLGGLVNNAAVLLGREHKLGELPIELVRESLEVNLLGPMSAAKYLAPLMANHAGAVVANISSEAGSFASAYGGDYPYALSKAALNYFSKQLGSELKGRGIRTIAVHPGWIRTDMGGQAAPMGPSESAEGILAILEGRVRLEDDDFFVDHKGQRMPL